MTVGFLLTFGLGIWPRRSTLTIEMKEFPLTYGFGIWAGGTVQFGKVADFVRAEPCLHPRIAPKLENEQALPRAPGGSFLPSPLCKLLPICNLLPILQMVISHNGAVS